MHEKTRVEMKAGYLKLCLGPEKEGPLETQHMGPFRDTEWEYIYIYIYI